MRKARIFNIEVVFVLIAVLTIFVVTVHQMSTDGILPGNDPAVHLAKARNIVMNERVPYSEIATYPPLLHTVIAVLQIFAGTLEVTAAAFMLKLLIATFNALILLSTYLLSRKLFGTGVAVASAVFTILSVPLLEMIFWGGYANFLGLAYIAFIFYIMNRNFRVSIKTFLLVLGTLTIVLTHQLSTFVFVLMFVPAYLVSSIGSKRKFLIFLVVVVGGSLALLTWYAQVLIQYSNIVIEHLFFTMEENIYNIAAVNFDALTKNLGATLYLALAGIPLTFILIWRKKAQLSSILIIFWVAVPFILSQSYLFGVYLPYHRFIYFFATPLIILAATGTYNLARLHTFIESKVISKITKKPRAVNAAKLFSLVVTLALLFILFFVQASTLLQRVENYPQFYETASIASYNSGLWVKQHSVPDGTVVVTRNPGSWFYIFSDHYTWEETDPLYSRNAVAEAVLYSFFEMENTLTLTREYAPESSRSGQELTVSRFNIWTKALSIPNNQAKVIYVNSFGEEVTVFLSETSESIYWIQKSTDEAQLVSKYVHELFVVEKVVTFSSDSSTISIRWQIEARQDLPEAKLAFTIYTEPTLDYKEALVPGVLDWKNPWDNASYINPQGEWAVVEGPSNIFNDNIIAMLDAQNGLLAACEFGNPPDWFVLGALDNRFIDALRLLYELDNLAEGDRREVSLSLLTYAFEFREIERWTAADLQQLLDMEMNLPVQERDFLTYIKEKNIEFIVVDTQKVLSNMEASPALDRVYNNGRIIIYTTKR